ncbi:hypothetical protein KL86DPRO_20524 [uncultured delta proteobacterium]|uniref:Uncharacterized protein n=1 Tax=uncultured delta proteobacterium TaxID=34034 RepID=A0A212K1U8_9DELT|nr:hypothetical protein KL86DPRO_20524 [uncultured delta proteobacterium]
MLHFELETAIGKNNLYLYIITSISNISKYIVTDIVNTIIKKK